MYWAVLPDTVLTHSFMLRHLNNAGKGIITSVSYVQIMTVATACALATYAVCIINLVSASFFELSKAVISVSPC